jgi:hypothetical protein
MQQKEKKMAESQVFQKIPRTVPYIKHALLSADAAVRRPSPSAITIATVGDVACAYPYADFQRLSQTIERTTTVAPNYLYRERSRRLTLYWSTTLSKRSGN